MTLAIVKRLAALESRKSKPTPLSEREWEERTIRESGMSREEIIAAYGSLPGYAYHLMVSRDSDSPPKPLPPQYKSHQDYYLAMIRGEA
jgi:hypothetical protein